MTDIEQSRGLGVSWRIGVRTSVRDQEIGRDSALGA